jgi:transposase-like protein
MGDAKPWQDEERLRELYVDRGLTVYQTADELGCSPSTICNWLKRCGIEPRSVFVTTTADTPRILTDPKSYVRR